LRGRCVANRTLREYLAYTGSLALRGWAGPAAASSARADLINREPRRRKPRLTSRGFLVPSHAWGFTGQGLGTPLALSQKRTREDRYDQQAPVHSYVAPTVCRGTAEAETENPALRVVGLSDLQQRGCCLTPMTDLRERAQIIPRNSHASNMQACSDDEHGRQVWPPS